MEDGGEAEDVKLFVPGRLCLFGEHSDWAGSYSRINPGVQPGRCIVIGTEQGLFCRVRRLPQPKLIITAVTEDSISKGPHELDLTAPRQLLQEAQAGGFWSYVAGTAYVLAVQHHVGGLQIHNHSTTLPFKKGLSSSAAICVTVVRAFNQLYDLKLTVRGEMECAYQGERLTPSMCGRMDQCGAFGRVPSIMTFDGEALDVEQLSLGQPLHLVLVDLRASKDTVAILAALQAAYPDAVTPAEAALHELLGPINGRITSQAVQLLAAGDAQGLGLLMNEAQNEFDRCAAPLCPQHLSSPKLHSILSYPDIQKHIWGGKGVGSQGDGTAQLVCRSVDDQQAICNILHQQMEVHCTPLTLQQTSNSQTFHTAPAHKGSNAQHVHDNLEQMERALHDELGRVQRQLAGAMINGNAS